tara:strand:- start:970 stop:1956 length:987 start_codon:yes stop_codon:yes gene_type:complete
MIQHLSFLTLSLCSLIAFSQCDVNTDQAPFLADPEGAYSIQLIDGAVSGEPLTAGYDTLTAFPNAAEGSFYEAVVGVRIPNDTSFVYDLGSGPQLFENVQINSIEINSVLVSESTNGIVDETGSPDEFLADGETENPDYNPNYGNLMLPPGFSWQCVGGSANPNECNWAGGDYGCISFGFDSEVPSGVTGAHRLNVLLDVSATYELFPGVPIPIDITVDDLLNYYVLVISEEGTVSIEEVIDSRDFELISIAPNPSNDYINIQYGNNKEDKVSVKIYDILGNLVLSHDYHSVFGYNEVVFDTSNLLSGIYTLTLSNNLESIVERVIVN